MIEPKVLTPSQLRYLLTMSAMGEDGRGIRCTDLAGSLGIAKSSVHNMIKTFIEFGYVSKDENGLAYFTDEGREAAVSFNRYYSVISSVLAREFPRDRGYRRRGVLSHIRNERRRPRKARGEA